MPEEPQVDQVMEDVEAAAEDLAREAVTARPVRFGDLPAEGAGAGGEGALHLDAILDVPVSAVVEVGRTRMRLDEVLALGPGAVIPLERRAGEALDVRVNGKLVARGEVVLVDESYGVRITEILPPGRRQDEPEG